ncbi:MAG: methyl-accepting chemotaxis protein [Acidobacteria bacterium]|nr:MAG: methyl-accepting chemotaxis protein [Acidobacteriota bacterium]
MSNESPSKPKKKKKWGNRPPLHKRQYIVNKPLQYRFMGLLFAVWFANSVFFTIVLYLIFEGNINRFYDLVPKEGLYPLLTIPALLLSAVAFVSVFGIIVIGIMSLFVSNQIAGPLHRAKMSMNRMISGDWAFNLQFRETDFLIDYPPVFNAMLDDLRRRATSDIEDLKAIESASSDDEVVALARRMRENKEALIGIGAEDGGSSGKEPEAVPAAVH